jgi:trimethylamine--corrinoid protein Co-methyltransferase
VSAKKPSRNAAERQAAADTIAAEINDASLALLDDPGVKIEHDAIAKLLLARGAKRGSGPDVVRLPRKMIEETVALAPREVTLANRRGGSHILTATSESTYWSCPALMLYENDGNRPFTSKDMADFSRLLDQLENVDVVFGVALDDVPPPARDAVGLRLMAENTTKHLRPLSFSPEGAEVMVEMKDVVGGGAWFSVGFTAHGPLRWTNLALEIYRRTAGRKIPATVNGEPMAGVSGPVTLAGAAAVGNAEILAGIVVNELLEPGRPVIYNLGLAHVFDMKTAIAVTGAPENHLLAEISAAMGRFYGLPSASWVSTESMCPDSQAALEKMLGWQTHVESGVSAIWGVGQLESEISVSPAQAVIDDEMISMVKRWRRGVDVTKETLALDVTRSVGITGSFLDQMHTAEHFRSELYMPKVLFRERRANWNDRGKKRLDERASDVAATFIANQVDNGLSPGQVAALRKLTADFVARVKAS